MQDLYIKNNKTSLENIKDNIQEGINHILWFRRLSIINMSILLWTDLRNQNTPMKILTDFL